ncbi:MAG: D-alanine--D-alanine ligase [Flavobacteriales bacterium]|nr:MAG: D-alanine--D-alanine ligase [Flavobacteriales bacterium]
MNTKKNIAVVCGGNSGEYEISIQSADAVLKHLDVKKFSAYKVIIIGFDWKMIVDGQEFQINKDDFSCIVGEQKIIFDCVFNAIHGTPGEDGKLQGYFDMLGIPYTSSGVLTSAITFNKAICKAVLKPTKIAMAKSVVLQKDGEINIEAVVEKTGLPCFVKPNNGGSSIGISKVANADELPTALEKAFKEDNEIIIEEFINGTELTCGVTNLNGKITTLGVTEIVSKKEFFDYEAKYIDAQTEEITPARISNEISKKCEKTSELIYRQLQCKGIVRIDYILKESELYLIEVNTVPGLTDASLVPKMARHYGISLKDLFTASVEEVIGS